MVGIPLLENLFTDSINTPLLKELNGVNSIELSSDVADTLASIVETPEGIPATEESCCPYKLTEVKMNINDSSVFTTTVFNKNEGIVVKISTVIITKINLYQLANYKNLSTE